MYKKLSFFVVFILLFTFSAALAQEQKAMMEEIFKNLPQDQQNAILQEMNKLQTPGLQEQIHAGGDAALSSQLLDRTSGLVRLSSSQLKIIQNVLSQTNGILTSQAVEALRQSSEFSAYGSDEIAKAKQLIEKSYISDDEFEKSFFKRTRKVGHYQKIDLKLMPFGYDFFQSPSNLIASVRRDIPVPSQYVVGPGDEVKILLWGRVNAQHNLIVDRKGSITIPGMGPIYVAGMTFEKMATNLIRQTSEIIGANVDISMGALKTIPVFVLGDVKKPGAYTIGSFGTIADALLQAGGPSEIGTMRNIQLRRNNKIVSIFDLYHLLLKGDKSADVMLQAGDVVFVPVNGPLVGIAGNVKRPAIYEIKDKHDLQNLFELAGGIVPSAYTQQIQIERFMKNEKLVIVDIDDRHLEKSKHIRLQDADLVKVFSIVSTDTNVVYLEGHVKKPGKYEMKPGMRLQDIIKSPDDLQMSKPGPGSNTRAVEDEPYFDYAVIRRINPSTGEKTLIPFHLGKLLFQNDEAANLELMPQDRITIFSASMFKDKSFFSIRGEVRKPGEYSLMKNARVKDAILQAGGLTKDASKKTADILRRGKNSGEYQKVYIDVAGALAGNLQDDLLIQEDDKIIIHSVREYIYKQVVSIEGDVLKPGEFQYFENMTLKDLVFSAGNILESAYLEDVEIASMEVDKGNTVKLVRKNVNLRKALAGDKESNVPLKPYDRVFVKKILDWRLEKYITLTGQVKHPGRYIITKEERLSSVIERAGGFTDEAYLRGAVFTREKVKKMQQKSIIEMAERVEKQLLAASAVEAATALSTEEIMSKKVEAEQKKSLITKMKTIQAAGRMTIKLAHLRLLKSSTYDIELENGDLLHIPEKSSVVGVVGGVMSQGAHIFSQGMDYEDYIQKSGGYSQYADESNVFILKVDGTARKASSGFINWNSKKDRLEMEAFSEEEADYIEPGDVIAVPEGYAKIAWLRELRDITQILMNTAVAAGVVIKLF